VALKTRVLSGIDVAAAIERAFPGAVIEASDDAVVVPADRVVEVAAFLRDDPELDCKYLNSLAAVDWVDHFEMVYHLSSLSKNHALTLKARVDNHELPVVPSVTNVWIGAHLQEREAFDLMGIIFEDHPSLKRIFLWDGFPGHPLRKDFLALPGGFKPGLQRFPYEFPEDDRGYGSLENTDAPGAPEVPRIVRESGDPTLSARRYPQGTGTDPAHPGGTAAEPDEAHAEDDSALRGESLSEPEDAGR
jgi:NADH-quinone oxidoreductase subunit C